MPSRGKVGTRLEKFIILNTNKTLFTISLRITHLFYLLDHVITKVFLNPLHACAAVYT